MFIARGLPGSGKSTLTKKIANLYSDAVVCAGDDFFTDEGGNYNFDASKLHEAHEAARTKAYNACRFAYYALDKLIPKFFIFIKLKRNLISPIIIDNTNVSFWEVNNYVKIAKQFSYIYMLIEPRTEHKFDAEKLFRKLNQSYLQVVLLFEYLLSLLIYLRIQQAQCAQGDN